MEGKRRFEVEDRVLHVLDGHIGIVESDSDVDVDDAFTYVRWLTPNNTLSCCCSICYTENLMAVEEHVIPMQRSEGWWAQSRQFCRAIEGALEDLFKEYK